MITIPENIDDILRQNMDRRGVHVIYFLLKDNRVVYVGQSIQMTVRCSTHKGTINFDATTFYAVPDGEDPNDHEAYHIVQTQAENNKTLPPNALYRTFKGLALAFKDRGVTQTFIEHTIENNNVRSVFVDQARNHYYDVQQIADLLKVDAHVVSKPRKKPVSPPTAPAKPSAPPYPPMGSISAARPSTPPQALTPEQNRGVVGSLVASDASIESIAHKHGVSPVQVYLVYIGLRQHQLPVGHRTLHPQYVDAIERQLRFITQELDRGVSISDAHIAILDDLELALYYSYSEQPA